MLTTWSQNWMRPGGGGSGPTISGIARMGQTITVSGTNLPCFVQVMYPGTEAYDQPWVDLDVDNPIPNFALDWQHLGMMVRVIAVDLDNDGRPTGTFTASNVIGPVLHAVDPATEPNSITVSDTTALQNAVNNGSISTIVLAAGSTWAASAIPNSINGKRITTPQNNPARIVDSYMNPTAWTNVTWEGIAHWFTFGFLTGATPRARALDLGATSSGCSVLAQRIIAPNIDAATYQNVPANLLDSIYRTAAGMRFTVLGLSVGNSPGATVKGYFIRNAYIALDLNHDTICEHARVHGWYLDCFRVIGNAPSGGGRLIGGYSSHVYGLYDENDATTNSFGSGNAPHPDCIQVLNASTLDFTFDKIAHVVGNTRAHGDGCTATNNPVNTNYISNTNARRIRIRRALLGGSGSVTGYFVVGDYVLDYISQWAPGLSRGGSGTLQFLESTDRNYEDDGMFSRSIVVNTPTGGTLAASASITVEDTAAGSIETRVFGLASIRPDTLSQLALLLRPRPAHAAQGAIADTGHMRPLGAIPAAPTLSLTPTPGGFDCTLGAVSGAEKYRLWYRPTGSTGSWVRLENAAPNTAFSQSNLGGSVGYDVRASVRTAPDGWSRWSAVQTVTTGATPALGFPAGGVAANITRVPLHITPAASATTWNILSAYSVPANTMALVVMTNDGDRNPTISGTAGWSDLGYAGRATNVVGISAFSFYNNTGSSVNVDLTATWSSAEQGSAVLLLIPRPGAGTRLVAQGAFGDRGSSSTPSRQAIDTTITRQSLFVTAIGIDSNTITVSAAPAGYTDLTASPAANTGSASTTTAELFLEAAIPTSGNWTLSAASVAVAATVAVWAEAE